MTTIDEIRNLVTASHSQRYGEGYPDRVDLMLNGLLKELSKRTGKEVDELHQAVTRFTMTSRGDGTKEERSARALIYRRGLNHGPLDPWIPHTCHITIELCWPVPDEHGNIYCLEIQLPWPCPDTGPITIPPIF